MTATHARAHFEVVGVVGTGVMGRGIAQLFARAGFVVRCFDAAAGAAEAAIASIGGVLQREVDKGRATQAEIAATRARLQVASTLAELADCGLVVEAIVEDLHAKRELFAALEPIVQERAILATNTSSLMVSEIAARAQHPQRIAGLHFFNPVPLMKVVEIIPGLRTDPGVLEDLRTLVKRTGHRGVVAADQPGFLINHAGRGLYTEGLRILEEGVADVPVIDQLLREAAGFRMGPFELMDLTGLDVSGKVMQSIYEQFQQEPRFRPSSLVPPRIAAGWFGRKTGRGWYAHPGPGNEQPSETQPRALPVPADTRVWIEPRAFRRDALIVQLRRAGAKLASGPWDATLCIVQPWGFDATQAAVAAGLDPTRTVGVDPLPDSERSATVMLTLTTTPAARDAALALLSFDHKPALCIRDSAGFITQRVLATIVNIAANLVQRGIASAPDLEAGVRIGLGYPFGPLEWGDRIGGARIVEILTNLLASTGDPRYRPSPWLVRRARLGLSLSTPDPERT